jgi:hypothetical protein
MREMAGKEVKSPSTWLRELVAYFSLPMKAHNNFLATLSREREREREILEEPTRTS